jgi:signal transduction histidine kinase
VAERHLHAALTAQIAVVMLEVNLTDELKAERDRVVTATRTERDRLRRDLHDGLGPSLSGVGLGLQALTDAIETNNIARCAPLLQRISAEVATAVRDIRRIIEDLRPAALDRHTLTDAVSRHAATAERGDSRLPHRDRSNHQRRPSRPRSPYQRHHHHRRSRSAAHRRR